MFRSPEARPREALQHVITVRSDTDPLGGWPLTGSDLVVDQDVPLFSLLRSSMGLPIEDARWWPARRVRQPGWFATSAGVPVPGAEKSGKAAWRLDGGAVVAGGFAPPTVALLERTLAALRG